MYLVINKCVTAVKVSNFCGHYLRNCSTLDIGVWVISVYFNIRNTLPKFCPFLLGHPVYIYIHIHAHIYIYICVCVCVCVCLCICIYTPHTQFQNFDIPKSDGSSHSTFHKHTMSRHSCEATMTSCDSVSHSLFRSNC